MSPALLVPVAVLGLLALLLYRRLVRAPGYTSRALRIGAIIGLVALSAAIIVGFAYQAGAVDGRAARLVGAVGMTWLATGFYLLLGIAVGAVGALVLRLMGRDPTARRTWHRRSVPVIVAASLLITGYGLLEARWLRVVESTVTIPDLSPQLEGYRVALVADLHVGPLRGADLTGEVVGLTNRARPDVVLLAGDLVDGTTEQFPGVLDPLAGLEAPDGVYAVTGNHEYYAGDAAGWVKRWQELGVRPLLNEAVAVLEGGATLHLAGVSDPTGAEDAYAGEPGLAPDLGAALAFRTPEDTTILISHQPGAADDPIVREAGVDLIVSGHTHGGQIWPFTLLVPLANPTVAGLDEVGGTTAYTTRGAGTWGPPTRVAVPPEVAVLTLTSGAAGG
ncbi:metallophosphoesterase [Nostocoides sp. F2B08]|uniref:metallophosphoesterase n=1 Tax=Nostocoides sp. F2B08 TaxID=2653936 RepID=UPI0012637CF3|nr:metallophosphoesterase [Tetrasphaera sp. F2B08]KAB7743921.1 metallophosphoesterase [Tetrasphaera sp. F2B08]